jgi:hypothetical protein
MAERRQLTPAERERKAKLEEKIRKNLAAAVACVNAQAELRRLNRKKAQ